MVHKFGNCTVCYEEMTYEDVYNLNCNHLYHKKCITKWINGGSETCPQCNNHNTLDDIKNYNVEAGEDITLDNIFDEIKTYYDGMEGNTPTEKINNIFNDLKNILNSSNNSGNESKNIQIIIRDIKNVRTILKNLEPSSTVLELKNEFTKKRGIPVDRQRLIFGGNQLENKRELSFYKLENNSIVDLVFRCEGS
ncbi:hypothetical protein Mgra_00000690 [Meloidogyne graminicola]|uniref:RING-type domain-containing protein n=1 Tax=Meloidogyne graminicola TaxID=189291 RepID=A0A8T0A375_9BILA|nr:hypothetical protein Mgra_00000690 [Meloidogyne graminicola]